MTLTVDATLPSVQANVTVREEKPTVEAVRPVIRGRGAIGAYYLSKRSPVPEPFGFSDIVDGAKNAGDTVVAGAKDVKDLVAPPSSSSSAMIPAATASPPPVSPSSSPLSPIATGSSTSVSPKATDSVVVNNQVKFGGCLEMDAGLVANVGADANFFGLFDPSKTIPLFQKQFSLFKVCKICVSGLDAFTDDESRNALGTQRHDERSQTSVRGTQYWLEGVCSAMGRAMRAE
jgi:hypothetical protein